MQYSSYFLERSQIWFHGIVVGVDTNRRYLHYWLGTSARGEMDLEIDLTVRGNPNETKGLAVQALCFLFHFSSHFKDSLIHLGQVLASSLKT
jgi:hypothetical protein